jgi:hypothetical protein
VQTEGVFDLSVEGVNDSGNIAVTIGDMLFYTAADTPAINKKSSGKPFGVALEAVDSGATSTINVLINPVYLPAAGIVNADIADDTIKQTKINRRFTLEEFETNGVACLLGGGVPTGATGTTNVLALEDNIFEYFVLGAGQTLLAPTVAADGLLASLDLTNNEGVEYSQGITARSRSAFTVGTDAFYLKVGLKVADVSGSDICAVGFRKSDQAYQATFADYTDKATLNKIAGDIKIETALNNAGDTTTDTTDDWADGEAHVLEVYVSAAGVVTYKIDGAAPTATAAFTFDSGDVVVPFFHLLHDATTPGAVYLQSWECGLQ